MSPSALSAPRFDARLWILLGSAALSISWLLPNHHLPYKAFHSDAWISAVFAITIGVLVFTSINQVKWHPLTLAISALAALPAIQYFFGLIFFSGTAWISSIYLLGSVIVISTSASINRAAQDLFLDLIFLAVGIASIASVGLQLYQWTGKSYTDGMFDIWVLSLQGSRPYGNLGQPNQLASLLLWGVLAGAWGYFRCRIRLVTLALYMAFLLFGLALTQSRTSWLAVLTLVGATWFWSNKLRSERTRWLAALAAMYFFVATISIEPLSQLLNLGAPPDLGSRISSGLSIRPAAWAMFLDAMLNRPWTGYGWGQLLPAQVSILHEHTTLQGILFSHSHNLFIDLIVWNGFPIGLGASFLFLAWAITSTRRTKTPDEAILLLAIAVTGIHAMLEFPLHYAYFLLPTAAFVGVLQDRLGFKAAFISRPWILLLALIFGTGLLGTTAKEYFQIEAAYFDLRFEQNRVGTNHPSEPPKALILNHLTENIRYARFQPHAQMSSIEIEWAHNAASLYPNTAGLLKLAKILTLNKKASDAELWLSRICSVVSQDQCVAAKYAWNEAQNQDPRLRSVNWPDDCLDRECGQTEGILSTR